MVRSRLGMLAVIFACIVTTAQAAQKDLVRVREDRTAADSGTPLAVLAENPVNAGLAAATSAGSCRTVGDYLQVFTGTSRFRGNAYHLDTDVTLLEVQMELDIRVSTTLHFAVYQRDNVTGEWFRNATIGDRTIAVNNPTPGPVFYSSGPLNVSLPGGFDYVMAFAWGADASVSYGRDIPPAPGYPAATPASFDIGLILGRVGTSGALAPTFTSIGISGAGAHSMILCLEPVPGACCSPSLGGCSEVLEENCGGVFDPGAYFFGERTLCLDHVCDFGACCGACVGSCNDNWTRQACEATGGVAHWSGASCPADASSLCPPVTGACCKSGGVCEVLCESDCIADGGTYRGDDTTCESNPCIGACCLASVGLGCIEMTATSCSGLSGAYKGDGTTCATLSPESECGGACCVFVQGQVGCGTFSLRSACVNDATSDKAYRGDGTTCSGNCGSLTTADYGACCMPDGTCINMPDVATCEEDAGGSFTPGELCGVNGFECVAAPCCLPDGSCERLTKTSCDSRIGLWFDPGAAGQTVDTCSAAGCNTGACCGGDRGRCTVTSRTACAAESGLYAGDGLTCTTPATTCDMSLGLGACCVDESFCLDTLTANECGERNGAFTLGEICDNLPDCNQRGACCTQTGTCLFVTQAECEAAPILGTFSAVGKVCTLDFCPSGACCFGEGCVVTGETYCRRVDGLNGSYKGDGTACSANACIPSGACCLNGVCNADQTPADCAGAGGIYLGDDTTCDGAPCTQGTCCDHGTCGDFQIVSECPIADPGVDFQAGSFCFQDPCEPFGACCFTSGDCVDLVSQTECQTGGGSFTQDTLCLQVGCEPIGACCFRDGTCTNALAQSACEFQGGVLSGQDTCDASVCPEIGACCLRDGTCEDDVERGDCEARRGTSTPDRTCGQIPQCVPVGACCMPAALGSACINDKTREDCETGGGVFRGVGTDCPVDGSNCGSCCSLSGCADDFMSTECVLTDQQESFLPGTTCQQRANQEVCMPRGACCLPEGLCVILTESDCISSSGMFNGNGTTCEQFPDLCLTGACCDVFQQNGAACEKRTRIECERIPGAIYQGADTLCDDTLPCIVGSCCPATGLNDCIADTVASECSDPSDFRPGESTCLSCEGRGACCIGDDVACEIRFASQCAGPGMRYAGDGTSCPGVNDPQLCFIGACCDAVDGCSQQRRLDCELAGSSFRGAGAACGSVPCLEIIAIEPANCDIDPAQPSPPDGSVVEGLQSLVVTFSADATGLLMEDLAIEIQPGGVTAPTITGVMVSGDQVTVDLDMPIPAGQWTCVTHVASGTKACVALLPGDVDGDAVSVTADVDAILADLATPALPLRRCDVDRSGACSPLDLLREIDLLQGAEQYDPWLDKTIPACPSVP